jgi:hypothetical protein
MPRCCSGPFCTHAHHAVGNHKCELCGGRTHGSLCAIAVDEQSIFQCYLCRPPLPPPPVVDMDPHIEDDDEDSDDEDSDDDDDDDKEDSDEEVEEVGASHLGAKQRSYAKKTAQRQKTAVAKYHDSSDDDYACSNKKGKELAVRRRSSASSYNSSARSQQSNRRSPAASTNNSIADEDDEEEFEDNIGPCEAHFVSSNFPWKVLFAMAIGVGPDKETLVSAEEEPFLSSNKKSDFKPTAKDLKAEVHRRGMNPKGKPFPCGWWSLPQLNKHLTDHPIVDEIDVEFLRRKTNEIKSAGIPSEQDDKLVTEGSSRWTDPKAFLRLYHVLVEEEVKKLFLTRDNVLNRQELDARNSSQRRKTFQEAAADLYNDPNFAPSTFAWGNVHSDFAESIKLAAEDAPTQVTPEKIMEQFNNVRAKVSQVSIACLPIFLLEPLQMNFFSQID